MNTNKTFLEKITAEGLEVRFERLATIKFLSDRKCKLIETKNLGPVDLYNPENKAIDLLSNENMSIQLYKNKVGPIYWHRSLDCDEIIICLSGKAKWLTEDGEYDMKEGDIMYIPKGISHIRVAIDDSEFIAIEIKTKLPFKLDI